MSESAPRLGTLSRLHRLLRSNWITSAGAALMTLAVLGGVSVVLMHSMGGVWAGPYVGLVLTLVAPAVFLLGLLLVPLGLTIFRRQLNERLAAMADRPIRCCSATPPRPRS